MNACKVVERIVEEHCGDGSGVSVHTESGTRKGRRDCHNPDTSEGRYWEARALPNSDEEIDEKSKPE